MYLSIFLSFSIFLILGLLCNFGVIHFGDTLDYMVFAVLSACGIYGVYEHHRLKRVRMIDERIPDFLRDLAESRKAGMTFTKAIIFTSKGSYGVLTEEIKKMTQQISWGNSVSESLELFSKRVNTPLTKRAVSLINEASRSGGSVSDVLYAASRDARELREVNTERRMNMASYVVVVYVAAFVFLAVVSIICSTFLPAMAGASSAGLSTTGAPMGGGGVDSKEIMMIFFYAALIQGFGSGLVAGVFGDGSIPAGIKHAFILVIASWVVFRFFII